jgi:PIN domain nuclease of toxin-antitoxin system
VIVLDTHAWIWFASNPEELSSRAEQAIRRSVLKRQACVSSISVWEVALLAASGRLQLTIGVRDWLAKCEALPDFRFVPVDNLIASRSAFLPPPLHNDPADRIIIATAQTMGAAVVTKDVKIRNYPHIEAIW